MIDNGVEMEPTSEEADFNKLYAELDARCKEASIKLEVHEFLDEKSVRVYLPAGRQTSELTLFGLQRIHAFLSIPFEKYVLLGDYAAICSYKEGHIEAALTSVGVMPIVSALREMSGIRPGSVQATDDWPPLQVQNPIGSEKIILGPGSLTLGILNGMPRTRPSLRIEGIKVSRHDDALELLERLANSFFFQLDLLKNVPVNLLRRRRALRTFSRRSSRAPQQPEFPKSDYDRDPISLYWYARSARGMPLLQFLAYYQTIEYYFPTYSQAEARRKVRNILKSPAFRPERDADVARILVAAHGSRSGFGDERSQLRATINECLEPATLRAFLTEFEERAEFFASKTDRLTDQKIAVRNPEADLRNDVADRIYDIRCKIVHTKSGGREGDVELLIPFSKEAELLYADIELIQFVAREVLISASSPLRI